MNDTERLDAIGEYGLIIATQDTYRVDGVWERTWVCCYGDRMVAAISMRDAIDLAVADIKTLGLLPN